MAAEKEKIEANVNVFEDLHRTGTKEQIDAAIEDLIKTSHKMDEELYKQAGAQAGGPQGGPDMRGEAQGKAGAREEDVIDADYEVQS